MKKALLGLLPLLLLGACAKTEEEKGVTLTPDNIYYYLVVTTEYFVTDDHTCMCKMEVSPASTRLLYDHASFDVNVITFKYKTSQGITTTANLNNPFMTITLNVGGSGSAYKEISSTYGITRVLDFQYTIGNIKGRVRD